MDRHGMKFLKYIAVVIVIAASIAMLGGCFLFGKIATPKLSYNAETSTVNWDAVPNASEYRISYNDKKFTSIEPHHKLVDRGSFEVSVQAVGDGMIYKDSDVAKIAVVNKTAIEIPDVEFAYLAGGNVRYVIKNYDRDSAGYVISLGGNSYTVTDNIGFLDCSLAIGEYEAVVYGKGDNNYSIDSEKTSIIIKIGDVIETRALVHNVGEGKFAEVTYSSLEVGNKAVEEVRIENEVVDATQYTFSDCSLKLSAEIFDNYSGTTAPRLFVLFDSGELTVVNVTIKDVRRVSLDDKEYVSVRKSALPTVSFEMYRNELSYAYIIRDGKRIDFEKDRDYVLSVNGMSAKLVVKNIDYAVDEDSTLTFGFINISDGARYEKTVKYAFVNGSVDVYTSFITYAAASSSDVLIYFDGENTVTDVELPFADKNDFSIGNGVVSVKSDYFKDFSVGAIITGRVYFGSEYDTFNILVSDLSGASIVSAEKPLYEYELYSGVPLTIGLSGRITSAKVSFDSVRLSESEYSVDSKTLTISSGFLDEVGYGSHEIRVHMSGYDFVTKVKINVSDYTPRGIKASIDNSYPNIKITYKELGDGCSVYAVNLRTGKKYYGEENSNVIYAKEKDFLDGDKYKVVRIVGGEEIASQEQTYRRIQYENKYQIAKFEYMGETYDSVITSEEEFEILFFYSFMTISKKRAYPNATFDNMLWTVGSSVDAYPFSLEVYSTYMGLKDKPLAEKAEEFMRKAIKNYKEPVSLKFQINYSGNRLVFKWNLSSTNVPYELGEGNYMPTAERVELNYEKPFETDTPRNADFDEFEIYSWEKSQTVYAVDELYYVIEEGVRPEPIAGSPAEMMYETVKKVMRSIVDDTMSNYDKVKAIFEWIVANVVYDDASARYEGTLNSNNYHTVYPRRCFYLEGVFYDGIAVCNGMAKAMTVMCGLEGIRALKITGSAGGSHAWNKVLIDGVWYASDPTWGNSKSNIEKDGLKGEWFNHLYTLMSDKDINTDHTPEFGSEYIANIVYDYIANSYFSIDGTKEYPDRTFVSSHRVENSLDASCVASKYKEAFKRGETVGIAVYETAIKNNIIFGEIEEEDTYIGTYISYARAENYRYAYDGYVFSRNGRKYSFYVLYVKK